MLESQFYYENRPGNQEIAKIGGGEGRGWLWRKERRGKNNGIGEERGERRKKRIKGRKKRERRKNSKERKK